MYLPKPLFPGTSTMNQLERFIDLLGIPSEEDIESMDSPYSKIMIENINITANPRKIIDINPCIEENVSNLVSNLVVFNPNKRISASEASLSTCFKQFNQKDEEVKKEETKKFEPRFLPIEKLSDHPLLLGNIWKPEIFSELETETQKSIMTILLFRKRFNKKNKFPLPKFVLFLIFSFFVSFCDFKNKTYQHSLFRKYISKKFVECD